MVCVSWPSPRLQALRYEPRSYHVHELAVKEIKDKPRAYWSSTYRRWIVCVYYSRESGGGGIERFSKLPHDKAVELIKNGAAKND